MKRLTAMYSPLDERPRPPARAGGAGPLVRPVGVADDLHALGALARSYLAAVGESRFGPRRRRRRRGRRPRAVATSNNAKLAVARDGVARRPRTRRRRRSRAPTADAAEADDSSPNGESPSRGSNRRRRTRPCRLGRAPSRGHSSESTAVAKLAAIASDPTASERRRRKSFAHYVRGRTRTGSFAARRAFFAVGGVETLLAAVSEGAPLERRRRALALCEDFWNLPDVAGGPAGRGRPARAAQRGARARRRRRPRRRRHRRGRVVVVVVRGGLRALRAATEKVGGGGGRRIKREGTWYAAEAKKAAARCDAAEALQSRRALVVGGRRRASFTVEGTMLALAAEGGGTPGGGPAPAIRTGGRLGNCRGGEGDPFFFYPGGGGEGGAKRGAQKGDGDRRPARAKA